MSIDYFSVKAIRLKAQANNWQEAVRESIKLLVDIDAVEPRYIEAAIQIVNELGPYMVITKGLALAHARPESGVKRNCIGLLTLQNPINFGNPENDPVDIVFSLGALRNEEHIKIIAYLAKIISCERVLEVIRNASNPFEVMNSIRLIEQIGVKG